ncbi:unnamed protein product [Lampetra planeri]
MEDVETTPRADVDGEGIEQGETEGHGLIERILEKNCKTMEPEKESHGEMRNALSEDDGTEREELGTILEATTLEESNEPPRVAEWEQEKGPDGGDLGRVEPLDRSACSSPRGTDERSDLEMCREMEIAEMNNEMKRERRNSGGNEVEDLHVLQATRQPEKLTLGPPKALPKAPCGHVKLRNRESGSVLPDTLHLSALGAMWRVPCGEWACHSSVMYPEQIVRVPREAPRPAPELLGLATEFLSQYYSSIKRLGSPAHLERLEEVRREVELTSAYRLHDTELVFGAKTAWRNASRCVGRIQWAKLQVFDARCCNAAHEMFNYICNHIKYATNRGNLRSAITIFPARTGPGTDFRIWNSQLISYAGYQREGGSVTGDPANVEFTEICSRLGWRGPGGRFDLLPLVLQAGSSKPELFEIPAEMVLQVPLRHPRLEWFAELGLRWYALPAVSSMLLEMGGLEFPACPFSGWYVGTEIGVRDLCDSGRYDVLEAVAVRMGLDIRNVSSLWKDQALVEINIAVLHSFQLDRVTIVDHHSVTDSFMKHLETEGRVRGGCPADWVWIVPPISGSLTPVFHQEMLNYILTPAFFHQPEAWKSCNWNNGTETGTRRKQIGFKKLAKAVKFSAQLMGKAMARRVRAIILYATETGKSQAFANSLCEIFKHAFDAKVVCMQDYDVVHLEHEALVLLVTSTFGNGDPPENGQKFWLSLLEMQHPLSSHAEEQGFKVSRVPPQLEHPRVAFTEGALLRSNTLESAEPLANVRFSVFGLGSSAYPRLCAFARALDGMLGTLGGERIMARGEGDELCGQEEAFRSWARGAFEAACDVFCVREDVNLEQASATLLYAESDFKPERYRLVPVSSRLSLEQGYTCTHRKKVVGAKLLSRQNLQSPDSGRRTVLIRLDTLEQRELRYRPGDHVGIFPANAAALVRRLMRRIEGTAQAEQVVRVECLEETTTPTGTVTKWVEVSRLPPCTISDALSRFLDISSPPSARFLQQLASLAADVTDRDSLLQLGKGGPEYETWRREGNCTIPEALDQFPSVRVPACLLITQLPLLQPRYYSISSSPHLYPRQIHLTVAVVKYRTRGGDGPVRNGICSTWLEAVGHGEEVPCFVRAAPGFHLPSDPSLPCILIGPGTGIAPFRGFWQQRLFDMQTTGMWVPSPAMVLVFGCRSESHDHIYKEEIKDALQKGVLKSAHVAYSRQPGCPKRYVQDVVLEELGEELSMVLSDVGGHVYVCGDVTMAQGVQTALQEVLGRTRGLSPQQAAQLLSTMKDNNRYHEDIFGAKYSSLDSSNPGYTPGTK